MRVEIPENDRFRTFRKQVAWVGHKRRDVTPTWMNAWLTPFSVYPVTSTSFGIVPGTHNGNYATLPDSSSMTWENNIFEQTTDFDAGWTDVYVWAVYSGSAMSIEFSDGTAPGGTHVLLGVFTVNDVFDFKDDRVIMSEVYHDPSKVIGNTEDYSVDWDDGSGGGTVTYTWRNYSDDQRPVARPA